MATAPTSTAITSIRRRARRYRPANQVARLNPISWAVEMMPTVLTLTSWSMETPRTRNGVAENTTVLTAVAVSTPAAIFGRSVWTTRTGVCNMG